MLNGSMIFYKSAFGRGRAEQYALRSIINTMSFFRHTVTPFDNFPIIVYHIFSTFSIVFKRVTHKSSPFLCFNFHIFLELLLGDGLQICNNRTLRGWELVCL